MKDIILLVGHGSRDDEGADEFREFAAKVQAVIRDQKPDFLEAIHFHSGEQVVKPCFLELADPPILDTIDHCVAEGVRRILVMPLFLVPAGHMKTDVPSSINLSRIRYPQVEFIYGPHLGIDPRILSILEERLDEVEASVPSRSRKETAVLLVGRGSRDPDANGDVYKVARLLWEGRGFGWVETCFVGITSPRVPEGIQRCVRLGARRIIVLPYFLFTGILVQRIYRQAEAERKRFPAVEILWGKHLGGHPNILEVLLQRIQEALNGEVRMNCDLCKYRVRWPGFEEDYGLPQISDLAHGLRTGPGDHGHTHHHPHHSHDS
jgi:sirohydrochlorin cobaltochelatase